MTYAGSRLIVSAVEGRLDTRCLFVRATVEMPDAAERGRDTVGQSVSKRDFVPVDLFMRNPLTTVRF